MTNGPICCWTCGWLEAKAEAGYVFDLAMDFTRAIERLPADHPARRHLRLIEQALRSDIHFLARHPTTLFQCLWNRCWWYDCPAAAAHHDPPPGGWPADGPPWSRPEADRLATLLESWRGRRNEEPRPSPGCGRSARPRFLSAAPSWPASAGTTRGHERGVRPRGPADRQRVGRRDGAGLGRGHRRRAGLPPRARRRGHERGVRPDGRRIVSGSDDKTVRVWDAASGAELACLRGHDGGVLSVAFDRDGRRIVSGSGDQTVRVWDAATGAELACLRGHDGRVYERGVRPRRPADRQRVG